LPEFLAIHQSDASLLGCVLDARAQRLRLGEGEPAAGVGFFQSDDLLVRKRPLTPLQPALPAQLADGVESEAALICAGAMPISAVMPRGFHEESTLPFRFRRWLFALAGRPDGLWPARAALTALLPDFLRRAAKGDSAAESLFLLFLSRLRDLGRLDDADLDGPAAARALAGAVGEAERALEAAGQGRPPLAAVASNGRVLVALRRGHPLSTGAVDGLASCARHEVGPGMSEHSPVRRAHLALKARLIASGQAPEGFAAVPEGGIVAVGRDLQLSSI
jgi:hypothetical protein